VQGLIARPRHAACAGHDRRQSGSASSTAAPGEVLLPAAATRRDRFVAVVLLGSFPLPRPAFGQRYGGLRGDVERPEKPAIRHVKSCNASTETSVHCSHPSARRMSPLAGGARRSTLPPQAARVVPPKRRRARKQARPRGKAPWFFLDANAPVCLGLHHLRESLSHELPAVQCSGTSPYQRGRLPFFSRRPASGLYLKPPPCVTACPVLCPS
jgi:hypothetical protein